MPAGTIGAEIRHLMSDKGYPQKRAVAAALNLRRTGKIRRGRLYARPIRRGR